MLYGENSSADHDAESASIARNAPGSSSSSESRSGDIKQRLPTSMGNLCGGGGSTALPASGLGERKKKKKKKKDAHDGDAEGNVVGLVENPMQSRKKKRASNVVVATGALTIAPDASDAPAVKKELAASSVPTTSTSAISAAQLSASASSLPLLPPATVDTAKKAPLSPIEVENPGKYGWLHRENDHYEHSDKSEEPYLKVRMLSAPPPRRCLPPHAPNPTQYAMLHMARNGSR